MFTRNEHNPKWCRDEINRLRARETELLEANNRYQQEARDAKAALAARRAIVEKVDIVAKERDDLAARVTELCNQIKASGQRVGIIAARYGWRGGENNIDFIARKMEKMNGRIGILEEELESMRVAKKAMQVELDALTDAPRPMPPMPPIEAGRTVTVDVTGMADLEKRVADLERIVYPSRGTGADLRTRR